MKGIPVEPMKSQIQIHSFFLCCDFRKAFQKQPNAPQETFPFPVFPPYPRGVVRVLSMDVVRLLAKASQEAFRTGK